MSSPEPKISIEQALELSGNRMKVSCTPNITIDTSTSTLTAELARDRMQSHSLPSTATGTGMSSHESNTASQTPVLSPLLFAARSPSHAIDHHPGSHADLLQVDSGLGSLPPLNLGNRDHLSPASVTPDVIRAVPTTAAPTNVINPIIADNLDSTCVANNGVPVSPNSPLLHIRDTNKRLVLCMVGLPARGKTYIANKLSRYLNWCGYQSKVFNIGSYRRQNVGANLSADFFDPLNNEGSKLRRECAIAALEDMVKFFQTGGQAAIYDGTNSTIERRDMVRDLLHQKEASSDMIFEVVWIETIVYDQSIVEENIRETKLTSPDYVGVTAETATADFIARIQKYQTHYQTLPEDSLHSYVKIIDAGRQMKTNRIVGYLMGKIVFFLMNLRINRAPIYITRHGESMHNLKGLIGGDSELSPQGRRYAAELSKFIHDEPEFKNDNMKHLAVWTSTMVRTRETASYLNLPFTQWRALVELHVGACDNMTYEEIEHRYPAEWEARKRDKLRYRYPQGESYLDVIQRLEPCILELERMQTPVLLIVHRAVARCFLAYFLDIESKEIPYLDAPLHSVVKLVPKAYSCEKSQFKFAIPSVEDEGKETST